MTTPKPTPKRKQLNIRMDEEGEARLERLVPIMSGVLGIPLNTSDVVRLALVALEEKHAPKGGKKGDKK